MPHRHDSDPIEALRRARPRLDPELLSPDSPRARAILTGAPAKRSRPFRPFVLRSALRPAVALIASIAVVAYALAAPAGRESATTELPDIELIAATSEEAYSGSGRAEIQFTLLRGLPAEHDGVTEVTFSGSDLEMKHVFGPTAEGTPGFESRSRIVDGELYLWDGPLGDKRWYHDLNASGSDADDAFDLDPRELLRLLSESADFEETGSDAGLRHLVATDIRDVPARQFDLWPADAKQVAALEIWVDDDDVVRRLDVTTRHRETSYTGTKIVDFPNGEPGRKIPDRSSPKRTTTWESYFSVRFYDVGEDLEIVAPPNPVPVRGQG